MSKRSCGLIEQACKWVHNEDGTKTRQKLAPDSVANAPPLFDLCGICEVETAEEEATKVELRDHPDRQGCDVAKQPFGVERVLLNAIKATAKNGTGGMATAGTKEDPHIICMTGDGAGLSRAKTGRLACLCRSSQGRLSSSTNHLWMCPHCSSIRQTH